MDLGFNAKSMSENANQVVRTLQESGYEAYLVGGCVRDVLIGVEPKDFDVATDAHPDDIVRLFRRSRIIGRRFKIVHVRFGRHEIIEVTTFRAPPNKKSQSWFSRKIRKVAGKRLTDDNAFGRIQDDVQRRDFTINSLYYDPMGEEVIDYLGALDDIQNRNIDLIGNAETRFQEDPVRMLRLLRFKSKLGFKVDARLISQVNQHAHLLESIPAARLFDEVFKFFHSGYAIESWNELKVSPFFEILFPLTAKQIHSTQSQIIERLIVLALKNTDSRVETGKPVIPAFFFSVILWHPLQARLQSLPEATRRRGDVFYQECFNVFAEQSKRIALTKNIASQIVDIWALQRQLEQRKPRTVQKVLANRRFRAAYDFLLLREKIGEVDSQLTDWWTQIQDTPLEQQNAIIDKMSYKQPSAKKRRKFRHSKQKSQVNKQEHK